MSGAENALGKEELERLLREKVIPKSRVDELASHDKPKAIVLAGQPGAGKNSLARTAEREFGDGILVIDPDEPRERLTGLRRLQDADPSGWPKETSRDAFRLANGSFLLHLGQLALELHHLLVTRRSGAAKGDLALTLGLPLPAGQQVVPDPQFPGELGATGTGLAGLFNRATLELRTELASLRHDTPQGLDRPSRKCP